MQFTELGDIYQTKHKIRIISATSLFDGHDASINMIRRILQDSGVEVIHLGHNRSVKDIVNAAIQENVQGVTISSYQGGHIEFFKYMRDLLNENGYEHVKIFGGGGGVIIPDEIAELHEYGISRIFSPDDGREMGPQGMINYILKECDFPPKSKNYLKSNFTAVSNSISLIEESILEGKKIDVEPAEEVNSLIPVLGITGTGGAGKSSLTDELVRRFVNDFNTRRVAILSVDPTKRKTGGALLADRIRMNSLTYSDRIFMRSFATRRANVATSKAISQAINICKKENFDLIIVETSGIGQSDTEIIDLTDCSIYVMTADYGAATQLEKIDMIDYADFIVINKFERRGSIDALRDVRKQYRRGRKLFDFNQNPDETLPIFGTMASQFNDAGVNSLYLALMAFLNEKYGGFESQLSNLQDLPTGNSNRQFIVPPERVRYLAEIAETVENYKEEVYQQAEFSRKVWQLSSSRELLFDAFDEKNISIIDGKISELKQQITEENQRLLDDWDDLVSAYQSDEFSYSVRGKTIVVPTFSTSLSNIKIPLICLPRFKDMGEILQWIKLENVPGEFPYTAGVFPFKRTEEDPTRMFAGEGPPERTNKRFHYLSKDHKAVRLSTAFDSVTLYGEDPHERPDIYGKIGTSGVSICSVEDMERLYAGFDLSSNVTSVSMTINGPAPIILAFFMNTAIRQQCRRWVVQEGILQPAEAYVRTGDGRYGFNVHSDEFWVVDKNTPGLKNWLDIRKLIPDEIYTEIFNNTLKRVRGTVQADILKEDQAQNTCIFSTDFALRMMGDVQESFIQHDIKNYYSVSISGYHIAEAGANPITQLAFTLANGFTYLEYYLSRGMEVDDIAPNFSFFFSNGLDPEYSVIGRVARRIWAIAIKNKYRGNDRSQKLKYHIQTSGRSLHAQEVDFNDIRTTLQALLAIYDNCNSLHTNAYDEAVTTPTEESVRRAMAIQLIINREFGGSKNQNPNQGSFIIAELTELVEEAVLSEFKKITERGGVLGAMETQYQRGKIQEESMFYEMLKSTGDLPIMGVNTFINPNRDSNALEVRELIRSTEEEKQLQISRLREFQKMYGGKTTEALQKLQEVAISRGNLFDELLYTVQFASLGQISAALYQVGGEYRRNI